MNLTVPFSESDIPKLKVGQPAMSHTLSTLRVLLQDELFVRIGTVMQPTPRAIALGGPVRAALAQMQTALHAAPAVSTGVCAPIPMQCRGARPTSCRRFR